MFLCRSRKCFTWDQNLMVKSFHFFFSSVFIFSRNKQKQKKHPNCFQNRNANGRMCQHNIFFFCMEINSTSSTDLFESNCLLFSPIYCLLFVYLFWNYNQMCLHIIFNIELQIRIERHATITLYFMAYLFCFNFFF